jgi:transcriptional regulator with XRE-family HTH domain
LSQERLAELADFHPTYISLIERGRSEPTFEATSRIAKALGMTVAILFPDDVFAAATRARPRSSKG